MRSDRRLLELFEIPIVLAGQPYEDVGCDLETERLRVEIGMIALDESVLFERPHAAQTRRRCDFRTTRQFHIGDPTVCLKFSKDAHIDGIDLVMLHGRTFGRDKTRYLTLLPSIEQ